MNFHFLKSGEFWTAVGSIAAVAAFIYTLLKETSLRYRFLQRLLNKERAFYNNSLGSVSALSIDLDELTASYFRAVDEAIEGIEMLTDKERHEKKDGLVSLLAELKNTHRSLAKTLEFFSMPDARNFFNELKREHPINKIYDGEKIATDAHTHCSKVLEYVYALTKEYTPQNNPASGIERIWQIQQSVIGYDREVIIPVMELILNRSKNEIQLIENAILKGDKKRAIRLKEKYWFDMRVYHQRLDLALKKMDNLVNEFKKLDIRPSVAPTS